MLSNSSTITVLILKSTATGFSASAGKKTDYDNDRYEEYATDDENDANLPT